jgi:hypothetical protein
MPATSTSFGGPNGNTPGRPVGSQNKIISEVYRIYKERGYRHPAIYCADVYEDEREPKERRDEMAKAALTWFPKEKFRAHHHYDIEVPEFQSIQDAENFLARLPVLLGRCEIESQLALELSTLTKNWIDAKYDRDKLQLQINAAGGGPEPHIHITGGLPELPGTRITMPQLNGHEINGTLAAPPDEGIPSS